MCVGVVMNPILDELFTASRGKGAFLNGIPIHVATAAKLENACISFDFGGRLFSRLCYKQKALDSN